MSIRTVKYPLTIYNGTLLLSYDSEVVRDAILSVIKTFESERIMRPKYGTNYPIFNVPETNDIVNLVTNNINEWVKSFYPDLQFNVTGSINEDGSFSYSVLWSINNIPQPPINL